MSLIKLKNNALDNLTSFEGSASLGDMIFISSATASSSASIEFDLGSYKQYRFFYTNIHPATDNTDFQINFSTDNGSNYNVTKTTTCAKAHHNESDSSTSLAYDSSQDLAQSTGFQNLMQSIGNASDESGSGYLDIFNPSSTTYVKHFMSDSNFYYGSGDYCMRFFIAGYANTTSALTNIKFQMSSGNIDDGKILMFGLN